MPSTLSKVGNVHRRTTCSFRATVEIFTTYFVGGIYHHLYSKTGNQCKFSWCTVLVCQQHREKLKSPHTFPVAHSDRKLTVSLWSQLQQHLQYLEGFNHCGYRLRLLFNESHDLWTQGLYERIPYLHLAGLEHRQSHLQSFHLQLERGRVFSLLDIHT